MTKRAVKILCGLFAFVFACILLQFLAPYFDSEYLEYKADKEAEVVAKQVLLAYMSMCQDYEDKSDFDVVKHLKEYLPKEFWSQVRCEEFSYWVLKTRTDFVLNPIVVIMHKGDNKRSFFLSMKGVKIQLPKSHDVSKCILIEDLH